MPRIPLEPDLPGGMPEVPAAPAVPAVPAMKKGGSASSRADGIAQRGKTRGMMVACGGGYMKGKK